MIGNGPERHSLRRRITLTTLLIFVASIWTLSFYASRMLRQDMQHLLADQQLSTVSYIAAELDTALKERVLALETIARSIDQTMLDHPSVLQNMLENRPIFKEMFNSGVIAVTQNGTAVADIPVVAGRRGTNYSSNVATHTALVEGRSVIGRPVVGRVLREPLFNINAPIRNAQGKVIGALFGVINLAKPNFLDSIWEHRYGKSGGYLVIDLEHNLIVSATEKNRTLQPLPLPGGNEMLDKRRQGFTGSAISVNSQGVEVLSSASRIPTSGWLVVATLPTNEAFAPILAMQQRMFFATILLTLLAGSLTWLMLRRQLSPMLAAVKTLAIMSDTDRPMQALPIARQDEIGELIGGFNRLLETLEHREEALKESEFRWKFAIEGSSEGVWDWDIEKNEAKYSKRWKEMLGYGDAETLPTYQEWIERIHPDDRTFVAAAIRAYLEGKTEHYVAEFRLRCKDESYKWILGRGMVVSRSEDGRPLRMIGTHVDISERKQAEAALLEAKRTAENASVVKSRFLAAASHDLRQPIQAIYLFNDALGRTTLSEKQQRISQALSLSVHSLGDLLNALLDISNLDAGMVKPFAEEISVEELFQGVDAQFSAMAADKQLRFVIHYPAGRMTLFTDPKLLLSLLGNLIGNALKYTEQGGILVGVRRRGKRGLIQIWDTGIGIAPEHMGDIFEEYFQVGNPARERINGLGLGLSIVKRLAGLLDAEVNCHSRLGRGTLFEVSLPLAEPAIKDEPRRIPAVPEKSESPSRSAVQSIVVIEDDLKLAEAFRLSLASLGMSVTVFGNAEDALAHPEIADAAFYITDFHLPGMNGAQLLKTLQQASPGKIKAVLLTGDASTERIEFGLSFGWPVFFKPVDLPTLLSAMASQGVTGR